MKKALLIVLSVIIACLAATTLTACYIGNGGNSEHTHNYVWVDNGNGTHKQHCAVDGCNEPDINVGSHTFGADGKCVCGAEKPAEHKHAYTEEVIESKYLKTAATCKAKAVYYYSCKCGEKGTETFEYGNPLGHSFTKYVSDNNATCFQNETKTANCNRCGEKDTVTVEGTKVSHKYENNVCIYCGHIKASEGLDYTLRTNNSCNYYEVSGIGSCFDTKISIPETYNNLPIKSIGRRAFAGCTEITSITIPNSVTSIYYAAFSDCSGLICVTMGNGVTFIGDSAFEGCSSLTNVTIGNGVTNIRKNAFSGCGSLTGINIPASVINIEDGVFNDCKSLKGVYITDVAAWCNISFSINGTSNPLYYAHNLYLNDELVTDLVIPEGVTSIGTMAFMYCTSLTSVTIPDGVKSIGFAAFRYCNKLVSVIIGKDVTEISWWAFGDCGALESINIPNGVTSLERNVFCGCRSLTSINIPNSVETIGSEAFEYCYSLTSVIIPDSVTSINSFAFNACFSLVSVTIPHSVKSIGDYAFNSCLKLVEVINNSDLDIEKGSLENGGAGKYALNVKKGGTTDIVNKDGYLFYTYDNVNYLMGYDGSNTDLTLPSDYNGQGYEIYNYAFVYNRTIKSVTIPKGVNRIGDGSVMYCSSLTEITYNGTKAEWKSISNETFGYFGAGKFTVHCTDGDLTKEEA